jgi:hypothetical protein
MATYMLMVAGLIYEPHTGVVAKPALGMVLWISFRSVVILGSLG